MRLYEPLKARVGRCLRVLIYARYSTDEQKKHSIAAQIAKCRKYLAQWGITGAEIEILSDHGISGEVVHRPGIDRVLAGIKLRKWDLILAEDSSRLYRNLSACSDLVGGAVDLAIRVILPGDDVDTANDNWKPLLEEAQIHHTRSNAYTRRRIKRTLEELWEMGAAVGPLRAGFQRRPSVPATAKELPKGPFFDEVDEKWVSVIHEIFQRIARGDAPWSVAEWTSSSGLKKASHARRPRWTDRNILELVRNSVYRGTEVYRKNRYQKIHNSQAPNAGKSKALRNDPENILTRSVTPIVSLALWKSANQKIDRRAVNVDRPRGLDNPLANIPRDSRGPLSTVFICGICRGKMHVQGRADGGYRCGGAKSGDCWNRATAYQALTHQQIGRRIAQELLADPGHLEAVVKQLEQVIQRDEPRQRRLAELEAEIHQRTQQCERLLDLQENGAANSTGLADRLKQREAELRDSQVEWATLQQQGAELPIRPTSDELRDLLKEAADQLLNLGPSIASLLRRVLDGPIRAIPYQQFGSNKVVLRAEFKVQLLGLLPNDLYLLLERMKVESPEVAAETRTVVVDLFEPSAVPKHARDAWAMLSGGKTRKEIQLALGINKRIACQAVRLGEQMAAAGLTDPFIRLEEAPAAASRWGKRIRKSNDHDGPQSEPEAA